MEKRALCSVDTIPVKPRPNQNSRMTQSTVSPRQTIQRGARVRWRGAPGPRAVARAVIEEEGRLDLLMSSAGTRAACYCVVM
jgi:hypothetical protein